MESTKGNFYNWVMVGLVHVGLIVYFVVSALSQYRVSFSEHLIGEENIMLFSFALASILLPTAIAKSRFKNKNYLGYGIPIVLLLVTLYFVWDAFTCTGKLCDLGAFILGSISAFAALFFASFYKIGVCAGGWTPLRVIISFLAAFCLPILAALSFLTN